MTKHIFGEQCDHGLRKASCELCELQSANLLLKEQVEDMMCCVRDIRKSDCGAWTKDCTTNLFKCSEGRDKRMELMRLLDKLYKVADV